MESNGNKTFISDKAAWVEHQVLTCGSETPAELWVNGGVEVLYYYVINIAGINRDLL